MQWNSKINQQLTHWLLAILIFLVPSNWFLKLNDSSAYVNGLLVDYLLPKLYATDLVMIVILGLAAITSLSLRQLAWKKILTWGLGSWIGIGLVLTIVLRQFFAINPVAAIWFTAKLALLTVFGWWLYRHQQLLKSKVVIGSLIATILFQTVIGGYQFWQQRSLVGYTLLGEPNLSLTIGLARTTGGGAERVLAYGTTAHPNVLAAAMVIYWLIIIRSQILRREKKNRALIMVTGIFALVTILWTQSRAALLSLMIAAGLAWQPWLAMGAAAAIFVLAPVVLALTEPQTLHTSITRRVMLNQAALQMWQRFPWAGVGFNNFTPWVEIFSRSREIVRFVQPAHHLGLLWLAETGLVGIGLLAWLAHRLYRQLTRPELLELLAKLAVLLPLASLDHYLFTLQTGLLLAILWLCWPLQLLNHPQHRRVQVT